MLVSVKALTNPAFLYPLLLFLIGLLTFYSVLFKGFLLDDKTQIINNPAVHSLNSIPSYFIQSLHYGDSITLFTGFTYRPVTYAAYTILYAVGQGSAFPFHVFLLLLYLTNAILVYSVFVRFLKPLGAFLAALIFLVHPANQEIATYIPDIQDALYFFFGICALLVVMSKGTLTKRIVTTCILLFLACLSKETGILFCGAVILYVSLFEKQHVKRFVLPLGIMFVYYVLLRMIAGQTPFLSISVPHTSTLQHTEWYTTLLLVPNVLVYYLSTIIMPLPALPIAFLTKTSILGSLASFFAVGCVYMCAIWIAIQLRKRKDKHHWRVYTFFLTLFLVSTLFHSQLIPLDVLVSKRWLYVQLFAAIGMISFLLQLLSTQFRNYKRIFILVYTVYFTILFAETILAITYY